MKEVNYYTITGSKVLVTGGNGFFGKHVCKELSANGCQVLSPTSDEMNLLNLDSTFSYYEKNRPDFVIHLAGYNGGIKFNTDFPADIFIQNTTMAINLHVCARTLKTVKILSVLASCAWEQPKNEFITPEDILTGKPDQTVSCHGYAKRNLYLLSDFCRQEYGLNSNTVCVTTLYGPGDTYDPLRTKVMGAMVKRFVDAAESGVNDVVCWGTGTPKRQFVYVEDAAKMMINSLKHQPTKYPLFIGSPDNISIKNLAEMVAKEAGFAGIILWDHSKPDGQNSKRMLTTHRLNPDSEYTPLIEGIRKTIEDYKK